MTVNPAPVDGLDQAEYRCGPFTLDVRERTLRRDGVLLHVTPREYQIAECLFRNAGRAVPAEEMLLAVWGDVSVGDNNLAKQISNLRKRMGRDPDGRQYVRSAGNQAYFVPSTDVPLIAAPVPSGEDRATPAAAPMQPRRARAAIVGTALVLAAAGAVTAVRIINKDSSSTAVAPVFTQVALTADSAMKSGPVFSDGSRVYFKEGPDSSPNWMTVPVSGGDPLPFSIPVPGAEIRDVAPGGRMLLTTGSRNTGIVWIVKNTYSAPERLPIVAEGIGASRFSPDGTRILLMTKKVALTLDARTGAVVDRAPLHDLVTPRWTLDGRSFAFARNPIQSGKETVVTSSLDGAKERVVYSQSIPRSLKAILVAGWLDAHTLVVEATRNERRRLWTISEGAGRLFPESDQAREIPGCASKGAATADGALYAVCDTERAELVARNPAGDWAPLHGGADATELDYSLDGKQIAFARTWDWTLWIAAADGSHARQIPAPGLEAHHPHWSPDARHLAFMGYSATGQANLFLVDVGAVTQGTPEQVLADGEQGAPTWSRDGKTLLWGELRRGQPATAMSLHAMDVKTRNTRVVPGSGGLWSPRWSRDGKHILALRSGFASALRGGIRWNGAPGERRCLAEGGRLVEYYLGGLGAGFAFHPDAQPNIRAAKRLFAAIRSAQG